MTPEMALAVAALKGAFLGLLGGLVYKLFSRKKNKEE